MNKVVKKKTKNKVVYGDQTLNITPITIKTLKSKLRKALLQTYSSAFLKTRKAQKYMTVVAYYWLDSINNQVSESSVEHRDLEDCIKDFEDTFSQSKIGLTNKKR